MDNQDITLDSLTSEYDIGSVDGGKAVDGISDQSTLTLEELNTILGKDFKDKATALKSVKDTYSYVGKAGKLESKVKTMEQEIKSQDGLASEVRQMKENLFYAENPQYKPYRQTISEMGQNPADVVEKESFKKIFADLSEYEKTKKSKSVLESNPRIGQAKTKLEEAKDLQNRGQYVSSNEAAVNAVLDAYELQ